MQLGEKVACNFEKLQKLHFATFSCNFEIELVMACNQSQIAI